MVGTPERRHHTRHRRVAAIRAQRAIAAVSPVMERDRRAERRRLAGDRRRRARAALLRGMREVLVLPIQQRRRRPPQLPRPDPNAPIVLSSDSSAEDTEPPPLVIDLDSSLDSLPNIDPRPQFQLPIVPIVDLAPLNSSLDSLPNIDPRPQFQLPLEPLVDLGPLDITLEYPPPLQHQTLREAYILLQQLQLPPLQPITPPPELPPRPLTPPRDGEEWVELEATLTTVDGQQYLMLEPPQLELQQPEVAPVLQFNPAHFVQPPPLPPVDWAKIAGALFAIAECEARQRINNNSI